MKDKVLISFSSYNSPWFLENLIFTYEQTEAGYDHDLLIIDHSSTDKAQLRLLEKYSKKYRVETRPNYGRAQGSYEYAWQNNKDYKYYFFMHDDSAFIKNNWLKLAVDRINDNFVEREEIEQFSHFPIGKVGFQCYEWQDKYKYLRTGHRTIFWYMDFLQSIYDIEIPSFYQHINDDRFLVKNDLLKLSNKIWNIEHFKQIEDSDWFVQIEKEFDKRGIINKDPFPPDNRYGWRYHTFQTVSEFQNDIMPMRYGYRTHCVVGNGYCQEELGWNSFWGNEYVAHFGSHNVFKRLALLFNTSEENIRNSYKNIAALRKFTNLIKQETSRG